MLHVRFVPGNECSLERIVLRTNVPDTYCLTYRLTRDLLTVTNLLVIYRASVGASTQNAILFYHVCLSVCLSVRHVMVLYINECTYRQTVLTIWYSFFTSPITTVI